MNRQQILTLALGICLAMVFVGVMMWLMSLPLIGHMLLALFMAAAAMAIGAAYIGSLMWAYNDSKMRGKPPHVVTFLLAIGLWPFGLALWFLCRPELQMPYFEAQKPRKSSTPGSLPERVNFRFSKPPGKDPVREFEKLDEAA